MKQSSFIEREQKIVGDAESIWKQPGDADFKMELEEFRYSGARN